MTTRASTPAVRRPRTWALLLLAAVAAGGCSSPGDGDQADDPAPSTTVAEEGMPETQSTAEREMSDQSAQADEPVADEPPAEDEPAGVEVSGAMVPGCTAAAPIGERLDQADQERRAYDDGFDEESTYDDLLDAYTNIGDRVVEDSCQDPCLVLDEETISDAYDGVSGPLVVTRTYAPEGTILCNWNPPGTTPSSPLNAQLASVRLFSPAKFDHDRATEEFVVESSERAGIFVWDGDFAGGAGDPARMREGFEAEGMVVVVASCGDASIAPPPDRTSDDCAQARRHMLDVALSRFGR